MPLDGRRPYCCADLLAGDSDSAHGRWAVWSWMKKIWRLHSTLNGNMNKVRRRAALTQIEQEG